MSLVTLLTFYLFIFILYIFIRDISVHCGENDATGNLFISLISHFYNEVLVLRLKVLVWDKCKMISK